LGLPGKLPALFKRPLEVYRGNLRFFEPQGDLTPFQGFGGFCFRRGLGTFLAPEVNFGNRVFQERVKKKGGILKPRWEFFHPKPGFSRVSGKPSGIH